MGTWARRRGVTSAAEGVLALLASVGVFLFFALVVAANLPHVPAVVLGVLYGALVVVVARFWGIAYAVPIGVASVVSLDWFYIPPTHAPGDLGTEDLVALAAYLLTGALLGQLSAHTRRRAADSETARSVLAGEQAALRRVATLVAREASPPEVFASVTEEVQLLLGADVAVMFRFETDATASVIASHAATGADLPLGTRLRVEGENVAATVLRTQRPARVDEDAHASGPLAEFLRGLGVRSSVGSPIVVNGRLWGVMVAASVDSGPLPAGTESRIGEFTELVETAISNAEARTELTASRARLVASGDEARRRIERNLHDGAQQRLVTLALELRAVESSAPAGSADLPTRLSRIRAELTGVLDELREISQGLHPAILSEGGLRPALRALARRSAVPVELEVRAGDRLPAPVEVAVYYVVSEALTNAAKHAQASVVQVEVEVDEGTVRLRIRDDGIGGADPALGSGLVGLRDRVEAAGGRIAVTSPPGSGTSLEVTLPVRG